MTLYTYILFTFWFITGLINLIYGIIKKSDDRETKGYVIMIVTTMLYMLIKLLTSNIK